MNTSSRPNILWIVTTQWRAQATGYAGDPNATTPALDDLSRSAIQYRQAVTPHPFGPFARAALLTGVPSPENGVRDYFDPLPADARTVAHDMAERGYQTAWFGKWHLAKRDPQAALVGETHARMIVPKSERGGFAFWEGFEGGFLLNDPWLHGSRLPEPERFSGYQSDVLCERAAAWITEQNPSMPWFVVVSLEAPHPPYAAPTPVGIQRPDAPGLVLADNVPTGDEIESRTRRELSGYYAHVAATDRSIGRLLSLTPKETGVVFTSVHGDMHGAHGLFRKGWPHEESIRVPLLARPPGCVGKVDTKFVSDDPVSLLDLRELTCAWADQRSWSCNRDRAEISMPSVVNLPDQCDRVWHGWRSALAKEICQESGALWYAADLANDPMETNGWRNRRA